MCKIHWVSYDDAEQEIRLIRDRVFIEEQGIPLQLEFDGQDSVAQHCLAYQQAQAVGTLRVRRLSKTEIPTLKLERLAVLPPFRGQGIGSELAKAVVTQAQQQNYRQIVLHAQAYIAPLYAKLGFQVEGEMFMEVEIPHVKMQLALVA